MKNNVMENMVAMWDGIYMPLNFIRNTECYLYLVEGPRSVVVNFNFDENWNEHPDAAIPEDKMDIIFKMEDLFAVPTIITLSYTDRQVWIKAMDYYITASNNKTHCLHNGNYYIAKENCKLLIKEGKNGDG